MQDQLGKAVMQKIYWDGALIQALSMERGGELLRALNECDTLIVNLDGVELLDPAFFVILCAVKRQANKKGKFFALEGLENPVVAAAGVSFHRSSGNRLCRTYCGNSCLLDPLSSVDR